MRPGDALLTLLLTAASVVAAVVPMVGYLAVVWWMDRYDREPAWMVLLTFAWGALIATSLSLIGNTALDLLLHATLGADIARPATPVLVAPLVEEPTKAAVLLVVLQSRRFDNVTDGFVYGAATGLGFGMTENLLYFVTAAKAASFAPLVGTLSWLTTVFARTFFSAVMHACASAMVGAALGATRTRAPWTRAPALLVGLGLAMAMHATWNGLLTAAGELDMQALVAVNFAMFPFEVLTVVGAFQVSLLAERRALTRELEAESRDPGTFPAEHVGGLASYRRRHGRFAPRGVDQRAYIRAATTLGFRRAQLQTATGDQQRRLQRDLARVRREIAAMLSAPSER